MKETEKFVKSIFLYHKELEEHEDLLLRISEEIISKGILLCYWENGAYSSCSTNNETGVVTIRLVIGKIRHVAITAIWDLLHEYGHF